METMISTRVIRNYSGQVLGLAIKRIFSILLIWRIIFGCGMPQQVLPAKDGGWSLSNPSAGLFESYEFVDGTPFSYDDPRYNPNNLGENRDPRLDYTLFYNGADFMGTTYPHESRL